MRAYRGFLRTTIRAGGTSFVDVRDLALLLERILEDGRRGRFLANGHFFRWDELADEIEAVSGRRLRRLGAPGWLLRGAGRAFDALGRLTGRSYPLSGEGMEVATRWKPMADSPAIAELGVRWRPPRETLADMFRWYVAAGRLPARALPRLFPDEAAPRTG